MTSKAPPHRQDRQDRQVDHAGASATDLAAAFLAEALAPGEAPAIELSVLGASLLELWSVGHERWPELALSAPVLARHLGTLAAEEGELDGFLASIFAADLYLACACARGDAAAIAAFDRSILSSVPRFIAAIDPAPAFADEVTQALRVKLLVAEQGSAPRIASYAGTGALASWVRVAALRIALNLKRERRLEPELDDEALEVLLAAEGPELEHMRRRYQVELAGALRAAFERLPRDQRTVLRLHYAGQLHGDRIATMMKVSRSTVVRWLASARAAMLAEGRRRLEERLGLASAELDSVIELARSRLDLSLSALFRDSAE